MATDQVNTMNLFDDGDGMVPLHDKPSTAFKTNEKNVSKDKDAMDSTPINDIMMEHSPMMDDSRVQPQMAQGQQAVYPTSAAPPQQTDSIPESKNPLNLTDDQLTALIVAVGAAIAVSKPVQDRLATSIPKFLNEQGGRSVVGLATTGVVTAIIFYITKTYIIKV